MLRIKKHFDGEGSAWTKLHKPISIVEIINGCDNFDEDKYTLMYMSIYGKEKVRGGAFCSINLGGADKYILERMICSATDKCVKCKEYGHYFVDCPLNSSQNKNKKRKLAEVEEIRNDEQNDSSDYDDDLTEDEDKDEEVWKKRVEENRQSEPEEITEDEGIQSEEEDQPKNYVLRSNKRRKRN